MKEETMQQMTEMSRERRIQWIDDALEAYFAENGEFPSEDEIEALADAILHEELTDPDPHKMTRADYPFMSEWQMRLRDKRTSPLEPVQEALATDGKAYFEGKKPRKVRLPNDRHIVDDAEERRKRNKAKRKQYNDATKPSEVVRYFKDAEKDGA